MRSLFREIFSVQSLGWHSCIWLLAPLAVFIIGWMHWWVAVPLLALMTAGLFFRKDAEYIDVPQDYPSGLLSFSTLIVLAGFIALMVLSGWGEWGNQHPDHIVRNACLSELVRSPWPVVYPDGDALAYNIGFWLIPALLGKLEGMEAARVLTPLWGAWGLWLCWHWLCVFAGRRSMMFALMLILFGSLLNLQYWLNLDLLRLHYFGTAEQIMCSANASLPVLLAFIWLACGRMPLTWMPLIFAATAFYSPLAAVVGLIPFLCQAGKQWWLSGTPKSVFYHPSLWAAMFVGLCLLLFYGNVNALNDNIGIRNFYTRKGDVELICTSFLIYGIFCLRYFHSNPLFIVVMATGLLLPFFYIMGDVNDLLCKGSVPLMACLLAFLVRTWELCPAWRGWVMILLIVGFAPRFNMPYYLCFYEPMRTALRPQATPQSWVHREWIKFYYEPLSRPQKAWGGTMYHPNHRWHPYYSATPNKWTNFIYRW